jgi:hypothetical protein
MSPETRSKYAVIGLLALAIGFSSYAETCVLVVDDYDGYNLYASDFKPAVLHVEYLAVETEILTPKYANNFNRLVEFPELGSPGVLKGHRLTIRGPPKTC